MAQQLWACSMCGQGFTRKRSANRHNLNLHSGQALVTRTMEYIIGRVNVMPQLIRRYLERPIAENTITILALRLVIYIATIAPSVIILMLSLLSITRMTNDHHTPYNDQICLLQ